MLLRSLSWLMFSLVGMLVAAQVVVARQEESGKSSESKPSDVQEEEQEEGDESAQEEDEDEDKPLTSDDVMEQAIDKARGGDLDGAIELVEQAREMDPENTRIALTLIGIVQARAHELIDEGKRKDANAYFFKAADLTRALTGEAAEMVQRSKPTIIYNEACSYAIEGNKEKTLAALDEAFELGWDDVEMARNDPDFESFRESKEFVALLEKHERLIYEKTLAETVEEIKSFETYDFDFALKDLDGQEITLEKYKGKVVIVDFWGTWCPPCIAEIPHFIKLKESYGDQGLEIIGLAYEHEDTEEAALDLVQEFVKRNNVNYPCALGDDATQEQIADFGGYPTTLFIDRQGVVRLQLVGLQPHMKLEIAVQQLMKEEKE